MKKLAGKDWDFVHDNGSYAGTNINGQMFSVNVSDQKIVVTTHLSECAIRIEVYLRDGTCYSEILRAM